MKNEIKIVLYIVVGFCFCIFCIGGCSYLKNDSDAVKIKNTELSIEKQRNEFMIDSMTISYEKALKLELIKKGKKVSPLKGYSGMD